MKKGCFSASRIMTHAKGKPLRIGKMKAYWPKLLLAFSPTANPD